MRKSSTRLRGYVLTHSVSVLNPIYQIGNHQFHRGRIDICHYSNYLAYCVYLRIGPYSRLTRDKFISCSRKKAITTIQGFEDLYLTAAPPSLSFEILDLLLLFLFFQVRAFFSVPLSYKPNPSQTSPSSSTVALVSVSS